VYDATARTSRCDDEEGRQAGPPADPQQRRPTCAGWDADGTEAYDMVSVEGRAGKRCPSPADPPGGVLALWGWDADGTKAYDSVTQGSMGVIGALGQAHRGNASMRNPWPRWPRFELGQRASTAGALSCEWCSRFGWDAVFPRVLTTAGIISGTAKVARQTHVTTV
jgi:hypothetical protein